MRLHLSVGQRIGLGFTLLFLMVLIGGALGLLFASRNFSTVLHTQQNVSQIQDVAELERRWSQLGSTVDRMLLTRETSLVERELLPQLDAFNNQLSVLQQASAEHDPQTLARHDQFVGELAPLANELNSVVRELAAAAEEGRWAQAQTLYHTELAAFQRRFEAVLGDLLSQIDADIDTAVAESQAAVSFIRLAWISLALLSLVASLILAVALSRSVIRPVNELTESATRLAAGAFGERVALSRQDEIGALARAFNQMASQLQESYGELERRVAERTQALETSLDVSRRLSTILQPQELVSEVVRQIQAAFDYYHVHIYLLDESGDSLRMVGGTGEAGKIMLAEGHHIPLGKGLVGRAGHTAETVFVPDVLQAPDWLPNPLLPETKAEVAIPISFAEEVLGVLDVQEDHVQGLKEDDVELLLSIASQVAIALHNARLLQQAEQRAEQAARLNIIGQKIQRAMTVEEVLAVAARELGDTLAVGKAHVELVNPQKIARDRHNLGGIEQ